MRQLNPISSHLQIKIIDFGLAQRLSPNKSVRVLFGTPEFIPPEIINYEPIGLQSDMWSVGVICYVLLSGLSPFMGETDVETFSNITRADYDFDDDAFDAVSQEAKEFISGLLVHRKEKRMTAKDCLHANWLSPQHNCNISNVKICTDKLKKFIIRRKWQVNNDLFSLFENVFEFFFVLICMRVCVFYHNFFLFYFCSPINK